MQTITHFFPKVAEPQLDEIVCIASSGTGVVSNAPNEPAAVAQSVEEAVRAGSARILKFYSEEVKVNATTYALENGIAAALRQHPEIKRSTLRGWVRKAQQAQQESLQSAPDGMRAIPTSVQEVLEDKRANNGRKLPTDVYNKVYDRVQEIRGEGLVLTRCTLRREILAAAAEIDDSILISNGGWLSCSAQLLQRVEEELSLSRRVATTSKRGTLKSRESARELYLCRMAYVCEEHGIPKELAFHMDETGTTLLPVSRRTLAAKGSKVVPVVHSDEKRQVTSIVGGDLAGGMLPLQIVYGPGAKNRLPKVSGVHSTWSDNHWANTDTEHR